MNVIAIDPGNDFSAYCIIDVDTYMPIEFGKVPNCELLKILMYKCDKDSYMCAIEMIASYGMAVGKTVFDTCVWIGRFIQCSKAASVFVYRKDVKMHLCGITRAKDSNIRQALIDRFGEVGTKSNPGWFYGFKSDVWQAYAVGVTFLDGSKGELGV